MVHWPGAVNETLGHTLTNFDSGGDPSTKSAQRGASRLIFVMLADDPLAPSRFVDLTAHRQVEIGRGSKWRVEQGQGLRIENRDQRMSSRHAMLSRQNGDWRIKDTGSKNGVLVNGAPVDEASLDDGDLIEIGRSFFLFRNPEDDEGPGLASIDDEEPSVLSTLLPPLKNQFATLRQIAPTTVSVVLFGESGTGKEVIARAVHRMSGRIGRFVAVNCGALPESIIEAELFGAKQGAFSGATEDRPGFVRSADGGTLFLDEIGDLPLSCQATLLRVLQEREVVPVGEVEPIPVDFRLLCATHQDVPKKVEEGTFRADLFARITGMTVRLPPLRERKEDLGLIIRALLQKTPDKGTGLSLGLRAARALCQYEWPLNVRELEKALSLGLALKSGTSLDLEHLPPHFRETPNASPKKRPARPLPELSPKDLERKELLLRLLDENNGNVAAVARAMNKARMQIHRWMKRYDIDPQALRKS